MCPPFAQWRDRSPQVCVIWSFFRGLDCVFWSCGTSYYTALAGSRPIPAIWAFMGWCSIQLWRPQSMHIVHFSKQSSRVSSDSCFSLLFWGAQWLVSIRRNKKAVWSQAEGCPTLKEWGLECRRHLAVGGSFHILSYTNQSSWPFWGATLLPTYTNCNVTSKYGVKVMGIANITVTFSFLHSFIHSSLSSFLFFFLALYPEWKEILNFT